MAKNKGISYHMNRLRTLTTKKKEIVKFPLQLRPYQREVVDAFDKHSFLALVWSRRMGKDISSLYLACRLCVEKNNQIVFYVFNTMKQGRQMILEGMTTESKPIITTVVNEELLLKPQNSERLYHSDNTLRFKNGSIIYFVDSQQVDSKVGGNINLLVLSEVATYKRQDVLEYLIPSTLKVGGKILAVSTPRYGSAFNDMMMQDNDTMYKSILTATDPRAIDEKGRPVYTEEELQFARKNMSQEKFQQEYFCDLNTANESSIYALSLTMAKKVEESVVSGKRVYVSFDLGVNDGCSLVFSYMNSEGKAVVFHWYYTNNQPTKHYVDYINMVLGKFNIGKGNVTLLLPHDSKNRQDGYSSLMSRDEMYRQQGFKVAVIPAIRQLQGIEICRSSIQNNDILFTDTMSVDNLISGLKKYEWKVVNGVNSYIPEHGKGLSSSNIADSLEYLCIYLYKDKYVSNQYKQFKGAKSFSMYK